MRSRSNLFPSTGYFVTQSLMSLYFSRPLAQYLVVCFSDRLLERLMVRFSHESTIILTIPPASQNFDPLARHRSQYYGYCNQESRPSLSLLTVNRIGWSDIGLRVLTTKLLRFSTISSERRVLVATTSPADRIPTSRSAP